MGHQKEERTELTRNHQGTQVKTALGHWGMLSGARSGVDASGLQLQHAACLRMLNLKSQPFRVRGHPKP